MIWVCKKSWSDISVLPTQNCGWQIREKISCGGGLDFSDFPYAKGFLWAGKLGWESGNPASSVGGGQPRGHCDGVGEILDKCFFSDFQELCTLGFPPIIDKNNSNNAKSLEIPRLVNCTYELLRTHSRHVQLKDDLEAGYVKKLIYVKAIGYGPLEVDTASQSWPDRGDDGFGRFSY